MLHNASFFVFLVAAPLILQGCSAFDVQAARSGISHRESRALTEAFYFGQYSRTPSFTEQSLNALLASIRDTRNAELGEGQASLAAIALAVVGDDRFARALSNQPVAVRRIVGRDISYLWTHYKLRYPHTQALLQ
jgi:hypothetical protein